MPIHFPPARNPTPGARATQSQVERVEAGLVRIEAKLDLLLEALAADGDQDDVHVMTLDGEPSGGARPEGEPL